MNKSILILEENSMIHGLIAAALDLDGVSLHHEFDPGEYVARARTLMPDLILLSNADQQRDYEVCRELRADDHFRHVPLVLLAGSKDQLRQDMLRELHVNGVVRKPFEASDLQQQVSKHLDLIDLIGSAFEYKRSQSLRDEGLSPLADVEVLDQEILGILRESAEAAPGAVPQVDFSRELAAERAVRAPEPQAPAAAAAAAPAAAAAAMVGEAELEEALEPERAFEPVESMDAWDREIEPESLTGGIPPAGHDFDESRAEALPGEEMARPAAMEAEAEGIQELGAQDILDEGAEEEARWAPEGFDQSFEEGAGAEEPALERVEMELAGAEVEFDTGEEELEEGEVELFETDFGKPAAEAPPTAEEEMIPAAVRRMVELKPVLTKAPAAAAPAAEPAARRIFSPDDAELTAMAEELEQMEEVPVAEAAAESAEPVAGAAPPRSDWELARGPAAMEDEEDFFHEDYLGDEEIDEDKIREALEAEPAEEPGFEVITDEMEAEPLEDSELKELEALDDVDLGLTEEAEEEEIVIEPDEESMVLASLEQDEEMERQAAGGVLEEPRLESVEEGAGFEEAAGAAGREEEAPSLLDRQLDALEEAAEELESEASPVAPEEPVPAEAVQGEIGEIEEPFISAEAREMAAFTEAGAEPFAAAPEAEREGLEEPELAAAPESGFEILAEEAAEEAPSEEVPHVKAMSDFDGVLAELQAEIEANPVGERLEDVLQREGIVEAVEAIDFAIPQHEHPFSRALGVFEIPGGPSAGHDLLERMTAAPAPGFSAATLSKAEAAALSGAVSGALAASTPAVAGIHEALVSRLTEVLDEMIRDTVRRVVREEMPPLMERMRESSGHGR